MNENDMRQMIQITTYRDEGGQLGGLGNAAIGNLIHWWLGQGSCLPTNEHPDN